VQGTGARRAIVLVLSVDRPARARARLLKRTRALTARSYRLATGRSTRRLPVPRVVKPGWYRLSLRVVAADDARTFSRRVRIRR
jgi:hypothetical protein